MSRVVVRCNYTRSDDSNVLLAKFYLTFNHSCSNSRVRTWLTDYHLTYYTTTATFFRQQTKPHWGCATAHADQHTTATWFTVKIEWTEYRHQNCTLKNPVFSEFYFEFIRTEQRHTTSEACLFLNTRSTLTSNPHHCTVTSTSHFSTSSFYTMYVPICVEQVGHF